MTSPDESADGWTDRLSEYLDGELPARERKALERHLEACEACARTLEGLRAVVRRARELAPEAPSRDLWPEIAARIDRLEAEALSLDEVRERRATRGPRRFTLSLPQLAAAAVALMALSGGGVWLATSGGPADRAPGIAGAPDPGSAATFATTVERAGPQGSTLARYQAAIAELEAALFEGGERLDTATVRRIRASLLSIDRAIEEARRALREDPVDPYVNRHLAETMRRKMEFLQEAAVLAVARG